MKFARTVCVLLLLLASEMLLAGTPGIFRGTLEHPSDETGWVFVRGRNGLLRRVEITRAEVSYADNVPMRKRRAKAAESLGAGAEVRVTAEQDAGGEWRASEIEILKLQPDAKTKQ